MTIAVMVKVWKDAPVAGTELLMLLALADIAGDEYECYPSIRHLASKCRCSEKQAKRLLKSLERQNVIEIMVQAALGRGKVKPGKVPNVYRITPDNWAEIESITEDVQVPASNRGGAQVPPSPDVQVPPTGDTHAPLIPYVETLVDPLKDNDAIALTIKAWLDGQTTKPVVNQYANKGVRSNAKAIADAGFTPEQVTSYVKVLATQAYWSGKLITIGYVANNIAAHYAANKPAAIHPSHVPFPAAETTPDDVPPPPEAIEALKLLQTQLTDEVTYAKSA